MKTSELQGRKLLLDTHAWLWSAIGDQSQFNRACRAAIEAAAHDEELYASAASVWEIGLKRAMKELVAPGDLTAWVRAQKKKPGIRIVPISSSVAIDSLELPSWVRERDGQIHRDPADRFIVATARRKRAVVITVDVEILAFARKGHLLACHPHD